MKLYLKQLILIRDIFQIYIYSTFNSNIVYLDDLTNIRNNDNINIKANEFNEYYKIININYDEKYIELDKEIKINEYTNENSSNCFVFGTEIDDFHTFNKDYIFTLNVCATQELHRLIQQQNIIIQEQNYKINDLQNQINEIKLHLNL